jgi:hypothetical protein
MTENAFLYTGVPCAQLEYWNSLLNLLSAQMGWFVQTIAVNEKTIFPYQLSIEDWKLLALTNNNVFTWVDTSSQPRKHSADCYQVPLECLTLSTIFHSKMCRHHRVQEFLAINTRTVSLDYVLVGERIPDGIHPLLLQCLQWFHANLMYSVVPVLRSFDVFIIPEGPAKSADDEIPEYSTDSQVVLTPSVIISYDCVLGEYFALHGRLDLVRINHIVCKFCFPSELGMCAHALDKNYEATLKNRPHGMKEVWLPDNITDEMFQMRHYRVKSFLQAKATTFSDETVKSDVERIRNAYRRYVYNVWNRIYKPARERFGDNMNILLLLVQFEKQLNKSAARIAESYPIKQLPEPVDRDERSADEIV